jgi:hypothetical protein
MTQVVALKIACCLLGFLYAVVSVDKRWGVVATLFLLSGALAFAGSAARDLARLARDDD